MGSGRGLRASPFFRARIALRVRVPPKPGQPATLPEGAQTTAEDDAPRFLVEVTVPQGALSERRTAGLAEEVTKTVPAASGLGPDDALRVWVLVHEQPDGSWGAGGSSSATPTS